MQDTPGIQDVHLCNGRYDLHSSATYVPQPRGPPRRNPSTCHACECRVATTKHDRATTQRCSYACCTTARRRHRHCCCHSCLDGRILAKLAAGAVSARLPPPWKPRRQPDGCQSASSSRRIAVARRVEIRRSPRLAPRPSSPSGSPASRLAFAELSDSALPPIRRASSEPLRPQPPARAARLLAATPGAVQPGWLAAGTRRVQQLGASSSAQLSRSRSRAASTHSRAADRTAPLRPRSLGGSSVAASSPARRSTCCTVDRAPSAASGRRRPSICRLAATGCAALVHSIDAAEAAQPRTMCRVRA